MKSTTYVQSCLLFVVMKTKETYFKWQSRIDIITCLEMKKKKMLASQNYS